MWVGDYVGQCSTFNVQRSTCVRGVTTCCNLACRLHFKLRWDRQIKTSMYDVFFLPTNSVLILPFFAFCLPENSWMADCHCLWKINPLICRVDESFSWEKYKKPFNTVDHLGGHNPPPPYAWLVLLALTMFFESCAIGNISQRQCKWLLSFDSYLSPFLNPALRKRMTFQLYHNIASGGASQMIQPLTFAYRWGI